MTRWNPGPAWLFCPANRPDRFLKAATVSDVVVIDLEDAVASTDRPSARRSILRAFGSGSLDPERTVVRINPVGTEDHEDDVLTCRRAAVRTVMLAKSECSAAVEAIRHEVILLIETPRGVENASAMASRPNVIGVMWGAEDLIAGLGGKTSRFPDGEYREVVRYARSRALLAAKSHHRFALDAVHMEVSDVDGLKRACEDAVSSGFDGAVAIHPSQVATIRTSFIPSALEIDWAQRVLEAAVASPGVMMFEGKMVDQPMFKQAERILRLANVSGPCS